MDTQSSIKIEIFYYLLIFIVLLNKMTRKSKYSILLNTAIQRPPQEILNFGATLNLGREIEQLSERGDQKLQNHISLEFVKEYLAVQIWQNMFNELNIPYFCTPLYFHLLFEKCSNFETIALEIRVVLNQIRVGTVRQYELSYKRIQTNCFNWKLFSCGPI